MKLLMQYFLIRIFSPAAPARARARTRSRARTARGTRAGCARCRSLLNARLGAKHSSKSKTPSGSPRVVSDDRLPPFFLSPFSSLSAFAFAEERSRRRAIFRPSPARRGRAAAAARASTAARTASSRAAAASSQRRPPPPPSRARALSLAPPRLPVSSNTSSVSARVTRLNGTVSVVRSPKPRSRGLSHGRHGALAAPAMHDRRPDARGRRRRRAVRGFAVRRRSSRASRRRLPPSPPPPPLGDGRLVGPAAGGGHIFSGSQDVSRRADASAARRRRRFHS